MFAWFGIPGHVPPRLSNLDLISLLFIFVLNLKKVLGGFVGNGLRTLPALRLYRLGKGVWPSVYSGMH